MSYQARRSFDDCTDDGPLPIPPQRRPRKGTAAEERAIAMCDGVVDIFAALFDVPGKEIRSRGRESRTAAHTRHIAMYVAHVVLGLSMREVGLGFGRDRTSVVYACHLIEDMRDDIEFDRLVTMAERVVGAAFACPRPE